MNVEKPDANAAVTDEALELNSRGVSLAGQGRLTEAAEVLERSAELAPDLAGTHTNLSVVYERMGRLEDALSSAEAGAALAPEVPRSYHQLCGVQFQLGRFQDAKLCYQKLIRLTPDDLDAQAQLGTVMVRSGQIDRGLELLQNVVLRLPMHARAHNSMGFAFFHKKEYKAAAKAFKRAVEIDPASDPYRFNLGVAQLMNNNKAGALSQYRFLSESDPTRAKAIYRLIYKDKLLFVPKEK